MLTLEDIHLLLDGFTLTASFDIAEADRVAVIGPSGGGKSTLLSLIAGFERPDRGRVLWQSRDITGTAPGKRPIAMLFQDNNLFPHLDVETNVALGLGPKATRDTRTRAREVLARVGLENMAKRRPASLSGGQQSRAALARLLLTNRPVILLDEPFAALGPALRSEMLALVTGLLPEATILMVTHDPEEAQSFSTQTLFVEDGKVSAPRETA
ncbi:MAG: ATP-binding cassette domain-containing protein, partial [Pseudomonadota bacterium]